MYATNKSIAISKKAIKITSPVITNKKLSPGDHKLTLSKIMPTIFKEVDIILFGVTDTEPALTFSDSSIKLLNMYLSQLSILNKNKKIPIVIIFLISVTRNSPISNPLNAIFPKVQVISITTSTQKTHKQADFIVGTQDFNPICKK